MKQLIAGFSLKCILLDGMEDVRGDTAPIVPSGRYRLRTHELTPVIQPRSRAASTSLISTNRETIHAVPPVRPQGSIARVATPHGGRAVLESIAFDPFSDSESFNLLQQDPDDSRERRKDPKAVAEFRQWQSRHFPQLLHTFRALRMIGAEHKEDISSDAIVQEQACIDLGDIKDALDSSKVEEKSADCEEAWGLILQYATVISATPGETIATEGH